MIKNLFMLVLLALFTSNVAANCLTEVSGFALNICGQIQDSGKQEITTVDGELDLEISGIVRKLVGGASAGGKAKRLVDLYEGVLRQDLTKDRFNVIDCRIKMVTVAQEQVCPQKAGKDSCKNPVYRLDRGPACGVELYKNMASPECGVLEYNTGSSSVCGVDQYHRCETGACGWNPCGFIKKCDAKECRHPNCGVERYKQCKHESFGVKSYKICRNEKHDVEVYKDCRNKEFGIDYCS